MIKFIAQSINYVFGKYITGKRKISISPSLIYLESFSDFDYNYFDYIRLATLRLLSREITDNKVQGDVAEVGVYKGKFAKHINGLFPDRTMYLFDTFEGFDKRDIATETLNKFSDGDQNFGNTSVQKVLDIMPHPNRCVVKQGYFPKSAADVEETFVLVSLDTDLYEPIYNGLTFFYPKLSKGGYIMIHDFNNDSYTGVRSAVRKYCTENNIGYTPLPDKAGTVIIAK